MSEILKSTEKSYHKAEQEIERYLRHTRNGSVRATAFNDALTWRETFFNILSLEYQLRDLKRNNRNGRTSFKEVLETRQILSQTHQSLDLVDSRLSDRFFSLPGYYQEYDKSHKLITEMEKLSLLKAGLGEYDVSSKALEIRSDEFESARFVLNESVYQNTKLWGWVIGFIHNRWS